MFKTKDFYLTSLLIMSGYKIETHEKEENKCVFYFNDSGQLRDTVQNYFYDKLAVSPHQFQAAIKTVKSLIYS